MASSQTDGEIRIDTELDASGFEKGSSRLVIAMRSLGERVSQIAQRIRGAFSRETMTAHPPIDEQDVQTAQGEAEAVREMGEAYAETAAQAEKVEQQLARLYDRQSTLARLGTPQESRQWQRLAVEITDAEQRLEAYNAEMAQMRAQGVPTEDYMELAAQLEKADQKVARLAARQQQMRELGVDENSMQWRRLTLEMQDTQETATALRSALAQMRADGSAFMPNDAPTAWEQFAGTLRNVGARIREFASTAAREGARIARGALTAAVRGLRTAATGLVRGFQAARRGIMGFFSRLRGGGDGAGNLVRSLTSLRTMLTSKIKSAFISQISNAFTEGVKALAQYNRAFDQAISNMKNRTSELGANVAVSFSNLLMAVEPIITRVIDAVSTAVTRLNALIAQIKGESTVIVAARQTASYAASLDSTTAAAKRAAEAQRKLNAQLGPYDELHKLESPSTDDEKDTGTSPATFKTVPVTGVLAGIPDSIKAQIDRIKQAVRDGDWYTVGAEVAKGLNTITQRIAEHIPAIREKAAEWAKALAEGLNGLTANLDTEAIGRALADGLSIALTAIDTFLTTYDFETAGRKLVEGINGFVSRINWTQVGKMIAHGFNAAIDFIHGAITNAHWSEYGEALGLAITNWLRETDFSKAGETLGEAVKGILSFIGSTLEEIDWEQLGNDIADFITGIDWGGVADALFEALAAAIGGILLGMATLADRLMTALYEEILKIGKELGWDIEGENIVLGILHGIIAALVGIGRWIIDHIFTPIVNGIKRAFGIASPATEMKPLGDNIGLGLLAGLAQPFVSLYTWLKEHIFNPIVDGIKKLFGIGQSNSTVGSVGGSIASSLLKGIANGFLNIGAWIKANIIDKLVGGIKGKIQDIKDAGKELIAGFKQGIEEKWNKLKDGVKSVFEGVVDTAKSIFDSHSPSRVFAQIGRDVDAGFMQGMESQETNVLRATADMASAVSAEMQDGLTPGRLEFETDALGDKLDTVAEKLAAIADAFRGINLLMPAPATGTVIPARVRIADTDTDRDSGGDVKRMLGQLIELLTEQATADRRIQINVPVQLDRRQIGAAVTEYNLSGSRLTNGGVR